MRKAEGRAAHRMAEEFRSRELGRQQERRKAVEAIAAAEEAKRAEERARVQAERDRIQVEEGWAKSLSARKTSSSSQAPPPPQTV